MKHLIVVLGLGFLWACSGDPKQQGAQNPGQTSVQAADATGRENESGAAGTTEVIVSGQVEGSEGSPLGGSANQPSDTASVPPNAGTTNQGEDVAVTPPHKVTGAYLVGTVLPHEEGEVIKIGLVAKNADVRLSDDPNRFATNWTLSLTEDDVPARLAKSSDGAYDRILLFEGSEEEFIAMQESISIRVNVVEEDGGETQLSSLIMNTLAELLAL